MKKFFKYLLYFFVASAILNGIIESFKEEPIRQDSGNEEIVERESSKKEEVKDKESKPQGEPNWSLYTPELKGRILNSNCAELQKEFDIAADNSDMQRARTGSGNLRLMYFIDKRLRSKGCY